MPIFCCAARKVREQAGTGDALSRGFAEQQQARCVRDDEITGCAAGATYSGYVELRA
jgi:hypothetical protein